jgi:signal transduction histidine kinase|tara:strand:+ start:127661 stop:128977 length:1317 start_codon:yes stop_codon:yes gene_type:complete
MFKSLKTRILFWFGSITFLLLIIFSIAFNYFFEKSVYSSIEAKLYEEAIYFKDNINITNFDKIIQKNKNLDSSIAIIKNMQVIKKTNYFNTKSLKQYLNTKKSFLIVDNGENLQAFYFINLSDDTKIVISKEDIDDKVEDVTDTMLVIEPLLLFALIFLASKMIDKILIPIKELTKVSEELSINNFSTTISIPSKDDEIKKLISTFNHMIIRLQNGVENLDRFNSDVSHELKTPLTVIRGEIDLTLRKQREPEYYIRTLSTLNYEAKQIEKIVENLLLLTKYSKENIEKTFEECYLKNILLNTLLMYKKNIDEKNITINIKKLEDLTIIGNLQLIKTIFSNLIDNAIKYTNENKNIFISLEALNEHIYFNIIDEGIGIPKEELSNVVNRFYRVDESRNKKIKGFGLGLSIVKNSIDLHNAKFKIESTLNEGTKITVIF